MQVCDKHDDISSKANWESTLYVICCAVQKSRELLVVGGIEQEMAEANIAVHYCYAGEVVVSV